jgi:4-diphosphocytidyl-2-C-methyl-D-erythritol kinase
LSTIRLAAPAKVNFGLRIVGVRPDGYHELESVFLPLDLADALEVAVEPGGGRVELALEAASADVPSGGDNLACCAARAFLEAAGLDHCVRIRLEKRIPSAAGLGGGSSDAAAVLRGLDALLPGALAPGGLSPLAEGLGADVPFFLDPRPALVTGIGEVREPLPGPIPGLVLVLVNPGAPLATAEVFAAWDALTRKRPASTLRPLLSGLRDAPADGQALGALLENDLEPVARRLCPAIGGLRSALLERGARAVGMSGSGATVYGVFGSEAEAREAAGRFEAPVWSRVARTQESR